MNVPPADRDLRPGESVGDYEIEAWIGAGSYGHVYCALQPAIGKRVAVKVLKAAYISSSHVTSRFISEARAVNAIAHPNIVDIFSFGQLDDGRAYHVMELLSGESLDRVLQKRGRLPPSEVIELLRPIASALDAAHARGIAHRDLKPSNIFIERTADGKPFPKLLDFGVAKFLNDGIPVGHRTATGTVVGTPEFMSPEQCRGPELDHRTDIYSFGVLTFQLLTGVLPFTSPAVVDVLSKHVHERPPSPSKLCPELGPGIDRAVLHMLEKDPSARPPSVGAAIEALAKAEHERTSKPPIPIEADALADTLPTDPEKRISMDPKTAPPAKPSKKQPPLTAIAIGGSALLFAIALAVGAPNATVSLEVKTNPEGAAIVGPDGTVLGTAPAKIKLRRGDERVMIELRRDGYQTEKREIVPREDSSLSVALMPKGKE
jgi:eukaryotic-like serine/threonine-protein kinase